MVIVLEETCSPASRNLPLPHYQHTRVFSMGFSRACGTNVTALDSPYVSYGKTYWTLAVNSLTLEGLDCPNQNGAHSNLMLASTNQTVSNTEVRNQSALNQPRRGRVSETHSCNTHLKLGNWVRTCRDGRESYLFLNSSEFPGREEVCMCVGRGVN